MTTIIFRDCTIETINIYSEGATMGEKTKDAIPGDIGHFTDKDSLASKLLDKIDKVKSRALFLSKACYSASQTEEFFYEEDLDVMETLLCEMGDELVEAHEMICSSSKYKKESPEQPTKDEPSA